MKHLITALSILVSAPGFAGELTEVYPNGVDASLQDQFERLCDEAAPGDIVTMQIAPGEYREQLYTICGKPLNIRIIGSGIGVTRFASDNDFKTHYHGIVSDRQFGALITCARAGSISRPDGTDGCGAQFVPGASNRAYEICREWTRVTGAFTPFETTCEVRDLSVDFSDARGLSRVGPASQMLSFYWNKPRVADVAMSGFPALQLTGANVQEMRVEHVRVSCYNDGTRNLGRGIGVGVNANGLTDPTVRFHGTVIDHVEVSRCDSGISVTRLDGGSIAHDRLADNTNGIVLAASAGVDIDHDLDFGNLHFIVPSTTEADGTVEPAGTPQGW